MADVALTGTAKKEIEPVLLLGGKGGPVPSQKAVEGGLIGNQGRLIELDCQPPEEGEVGFHLVETIRRDLDGIPEIVLKSILDHLAVTACEPPVADKFPVRQHDSPGDGAEHAVDGVDGLLTERGKTEHLPAELREGTPLEGHLGIIERRPRCLGGEAAKLDGDLLFHQRIVQVEPDTGTRIERTERVDTVEKEVGPAIPEIVEVEDRVDVGRGVACRYPAHVETANLKHRIWNAYPVIERVAGDDVHKSGKLDSL